MRKLYSLSDLYNIFVDETSFLFALYENTPNEVGYIYSGISSFRANDYNSRTAYHLFRAKCRNSSSCTANAVAVFPLTLGVVRKCLSIVEYLLVHSTCIYFVVHRLYLYICYIFPFFVCLYTFRINL